MDQVFKCSRQLFVLWILVMLGFSNTVSAQGSSGLRLGFNTSKLSGKAVIEQEDQYMPGFYIGGVYQYRHTGHAFETGLLLTSKGHQQHSVGDVTISNVFLYIELPVLYKRQIYSSNHLAINLLAGPSFLYKIIAINMISEIEGIRATDISLDFGCSIDLDRVCLEFRYCNGVINIDLYEPPKYNQTFSIGMQFTFKDRKI